MKRITNSPLEALSGSVRELLFYQVGGKTSSRKKSGKQSECAKAKTSQLKRRYLSVMSQPYAFLRNITQILRFGHQNVTNGASRAFHAAVSLSHKNSFRLEEH